jgi:lysophospholipase L1-like esterase
METTSSKTPAKWSRKSLLKRLAILCLAIAIGLLMLEGMARVIYNRNGMHFGIEMWKYAKYIKRQSGNLAMSHEHTPNSEAFLMGVPVKINSQGLRDDERDLSKDPQTFRILMLGDSITFGWGVRQEETFSKVLERLLNDRPPEGPWQRYEVINTGVGNYNTAQEVAYFSERGQRYRPDMVMLAWFINDAEDTPKPVENWLARQSCLYTFVSSAWDDLARNTQARPSYKEYYAGLFEDGKEGWTACQRALDELAETCRRESFDLRILLIPELHSLGADYEFKDIYAKLQRIAEKHKVTCLNLVDAFPQEDPKSFWVSPGDAHPNGRAHAIIAEALYGMLARERSGATVSPDRARSN